MIIFGVQVDFVWYLMNILKNIKISLILLLKSVIKHNFLVKFFCFSTFKVCQKNGAGRQSSYSLKSLEAAREATYQKIRSGEERQREIQTFCKSHQIRVFVQFSYLFLNISLINLARLILVTSFLDQYKFWALETIPEKITLNKLFALEWLKFLWWDFLAPKSEKFKHRKWAVSEKLQIAPKLEYRRS